MQSTNGTYVNGTKMAYGVLVLLNENDLITFGCSAMEVDLLTNRKALGLHYYAMELKYGILTEIPDSTSQFEMQQTRTQ